MLLVRAARHNSIYTFSFRANAQEIPSKMAKISDLMVKIDDQRYKNERFQIMMKNYDVPTVDVYIELKMSLDRIEKREDQLLRKHNLESLIETNKNSSRRQRAKSAKEKRRPSSKLTRRPTTNYSIPGKLFHGKTFNIVYHPDAGQSA